MRSSSAVGEPRPSWLLVVTHSEPSGAVTTVRSRPNWPWSRARGLPSPEAVRGIVQSRRPASAATYSVSPEIAAPLGDASLVDHVTSGLTNAALLPVPSTVGHP